jgi:hypothetical protein
MTKKASKTTKGTLEEKDMFAQREKGSVFEASVKAHHSLGKSHICGTDTRGFETPRNKSPLELVLDSTEGFIPLWAKGTKLRWRFDDASMSYFQNPQSAKQGIEELFAEAVDAWGDSAPVAFVKRDDAWDFEISMRPGDNCGGGGCVLASAFFPDTGRHQLAIYPKMFSQVRKEQVETLIHEVGHIFGLRHFFANIREKAWPSVTYGTHDAFTIMNYGEKSMLTENDKSDLKTLYQQAWSGALEDINGTKIVLVRPYHTLVDA